MFNNEEEHPSKEHLMLEYNNAEEDEWSHSKRTSSKYDKIVKSRRQIVFTLLPYLLLILIGARELIQYKRNEGKPAIPSQLSYSPVQHLIEYELRQFGEGHQESDDSIYLGEPSEELDQRWLDLYPSLFQLINREEAAKLRNKTVILPHEPDRRYVIELSVFHQLHCLNMIRMSLRPDIYSDFAMGEVDGHPEDLLLGPRHMGHCVEMLRQSIMCQVDITPYTWRWNETRNSLQNVFANPHTCRNFDKVREWSRPENNGGRLEITGFDGSYRVMNDPLDPGSWENGYHGE